MSSMERKLARGEVFSDIFLHLCSPVRTLSETELIQCIRTAASMKILRVILTARGLSILVAFAAYYAAAPSSARAECGDYVQMGSHNGGWNESTQKASARQSHRQGMPSSPTKPCSGPSCSNQSAPSAPAPKISLESKDLGLPSLIADIPAMGGERLRCTDEPGLPVRNPDSTYHPPR
jgi:hypothetical protein